MTRPPSSCDSGHAHHSCPRPPGFHSRPRHYSGAAEASIWWCCRRGSSPGRMRHPARSREQLRGGRGERFTQGTAKSGFPTLHRPSFLSARQAPPSVCSLTLRTSLTPTIFQEPPPLKDVLFRVPRRCQDSPLFAFSHISHLECPHHPSFSMKCLPILYS